MRTGVSLDGLVRVYWSMGAYDEAEPLYQEALRIKKSLDGLARLYYAKGACDKAEALHQEALRLKKSVLSEAGSPSCTMQGAGWGRPSWSQPSSRLAWLGTSRTAAWSLRARWSFSHHPP